MPAAPYGRGKKASPNAELLKLNLSVGPAAAELPGRMAAISANLTPSLFCPLTTAEKKRKMKKGQR